MAERTNQEVPKPYNGIQLEAPKGLVRQSDSILLDMIRGESSTQNMDWTDYMSTLPFRVLEDNFPDTYEAVCRIFSLLNLDYQVNNGGIEQYFYNYYHEEKEPHNETDTHHYGIDTQKEELLALVKFAETIYSNRLEENQKFQDAVDAFQYCHLEEHVEEYETIYSDEDKYIYEEECEDWIINPAYEEPYDELVGYEDIVHDEANFDGKHTSISPYLEELLELKSQYVVKDFVRELEKDMDKHQELIKELQKILPESTFNKLHNKEQYKLSAMIQSAEDRTDVQSPDKQEQRFTPER